MSETIDDGGPAFPLPGDGTQNGMTLRDWFAGQALAGICVANQDSAHLEDWNSGLVAKYAYKFADAMLAARKETK